MYEKRVEKGCAWLDQMEPEWWKKINLNTLALDDCDECALGLTFGKNVSLNLNHDLGFSVSHGFNLGDGIFVKNDKKAFRRLTATWIREILRRRANDRMQSDILSRKAAGVPAR